MIEKLNSYNGRDIVHVGWLRHEVPTSGECPDVVKSRLYYMIENCTIQHYMGTHVCEMCGYSEGGHNNGEIWVIGKNKVWIAPAMILHYIHHHYYLPPQEFIRDIQNQTKEEAMVFKKMYDDNIKKEGKGEYQKYSRSYPQVSL